MTLTFATGGGTGQITGHSIQPISTGYQWSAFGPKGRKYGKAKSRYQAITDAKEAERELA